MREVPDQAIRACLSHFQAVDVQYITRKEFTYQWAVSGRSALIRIPDYLADSAGDIQASFCDMVCRRARGIDWSFPSDCLDHIRSDGYILSGRPVYLSRSRNLSRTTTGTCRDLSESVQRLLDAGLLSESDVGNSYMSWTRRGALRRMGFCSTMFRVVGISSTLDSDEIPDHVVDYVVYHECLHLRQGYRPDHRSHDPQFRSWERSYPDWAVAERSLKAIAGGGPTRLSKRRDIRST